MGENTFHVDLSKISEMLEQMMKDAYAKDLQELMDELVADITASTVQ